MRIRKYAHLVVGVQEIIIVGKWVFCKSDDEVRTPSCQNYISPAVKVAHELFNILSQLPVRRGKASRLEIKK